MEVLDRGVVVAGGGGGWLKGSVSVPVSTCGWVYTLVRVSRWQTVFSTYKRGTVVPPLTSAASAPRCLSHAGASNALHEVCPKTVQFGGCSQESGDESKDPPSPKLSQPRDPKTKLSTLLAHRRWGKVFLPHGRGVPPLTGAASVPCRPSHVGVGNASHSVIPKTVQFGGRSPRQTRRVLSHSARRSGLRNVTHHCAQQ